MFLREDLLPIEKRYLIRYLNNNYDYCYLDSMHCMQETRGAEVIITGSSHGLDAVNASELEMSAVNLSMHTQDLYYDYLNIKKAVLNNTSIKICVMTIGYYSLYYDLSKTTYNYRCFEVYDPLFLDKHNATENYYCEGFKAPSLSEKEFYRSYFTKYNNYYGPAVLREHTNAEIRELGGWNSIDALQRDRFAMERAAKHNKHIKYLMTYKENCEILLKISKLCSEKGIRLILAVMPFSKEYLRYINQEYKNALMKVLADIPYMVEFADFNDIDCFTSEDFIDSDHMSDVGAAKATDILGTVII